MTENAKWLMGCSTPRGLMQSTPVGQIRYYCTDEDITEIAQAIGKDIDENCKKPIQQFILLDNLCLIYKCWTCIRLSTKQGRAIQKLYDHYSKVVINYIKHH